MSDQPPVADYIVRRLALEGLANDCHWDEAGQTSSGEKTHA
jgi:hypothetical protein